MTPGDLLGRINRLQRRLVFKIAASAAIVVLAVAAITTYIVQHNAQKGITVEVVDHAESPAGSGAGAPTPATTGDQPREDPKLAEMRENLRAGAEADVKSINDLLSARTDWTGVAVLIAEMAALLLALIWLGLGAWSMGVLGVMALVSWRLKLFTGRFVQLDELGTFDSVVAFVGAVAVLTTAFLVLMEVLKLSFSASRPVTAVARNVINEALRMKVSLVFMVFLIFGLAALPGLLDPGTPLRYRVQNFLAYGNEGTFWVIAILIVFLSVGTVAFEQRDRIIWQTMTKPVAAWQYMLGKWMGVMGIAGVLLLVSASGVFVFTEFLSKQKAMDEEYPFVAKEGGIISQDRMILQGQVLAARKTVRPALPEFEPDEFKKRLDERVQRAQATNPTDIADVDKLRAELERDLREEMRTNYFAVEPGQNQMYKFEGLGQARRDLWLSPERYAARMRMSVAAVNEAIEKNRVQSRKTPVGGVEVHAVDVRQMTLRYKIQAGGNDPRTMLRVSFELPNQSDAIVQSVPLNATLTLDVPPSALTEDGDLFVRVTNGDIVTRTANPGVFIFPPDGLELRYVVGTYHINFARVILIQWLKLGFLAMSALVAATFLSFPVASMIAFGTFLLAESARFIWEALNYYDATVEGKLMIHRLLVRGIAVPLAWVFKYYSDIDPIGNLADGRLVSWGVVFWTATIMLGTCAVLYVAGVLIFRKRELAVYSGQ